MVNGFCVKCGRENKENGKNKSLQGAVIHMTAKGGYMAKGKCPDCGTTVCAMMSKANADAAMAAGEATKE